MFYVFAKPIGNGQFGEHNFIYEIKVLWLFYFL